jgi:hypothetical protein
MCLVCPPELEFSAIKVALTLSHLTTIGSSFGIASCHLICDLNPDDKRLPQMILVPLPNQVHSMQYQPFNYQSPSGASINLDGSGLNQLQYADCKE